MNSISCPPKSDLRILRAAGRIVVCSVLTLLALLIATPAGAQNKSSSYPKASKVTSHATGTSHSTADKLPRSVPDSAVPHAGSTAATRQELSRLEHAPVAHSKAAAHSTAKAAAVHSTTASKSRNQSAPINFSYHGPSNGKADHRNPEAPAR